MKTMAPLGPLPEVEEGPRCPLGLRGHDPIKQSFQGQEKSFPRAVPAACLGDLPSLMSWWEMGCGREGSSPPSHLPRHPAHILAPGQCVLCQTFSIGETLLLAGHCSYHRLECRDLLVSGKGSLDAAELGKWFGELVFLGCLGRGNVSLSPILAFVLSGGFRMFLAGWALQGDASDDDNDAKNSQHIWSVSTCQALA